MNHYRKVFLSIVAFAFLASPSVHAKTVKISAELENAVVRAGVKQTTFLKVALTGFQLDEESERAPTNIAIVLDKSGSMQGSKMLNAQRAAIMAVDLLNENDIVSVISYDSTVRVIVPATKVSDKASIHAAINSMRAEGKTALFAGVSKGAAEVRKFIDRDRVNRVILLSDGQANIGPSSPTELGELGASLSKDGITVTTIGLGVGYNEDLMANLAGFSDGNHAFVDNADDLARVFKYEIGDVLSVVAQDVEINIQCKNGIKPIRILGREGSIRGQNVTIHMNQLYSEQEKFVLIEVEVPARKPKKNVLLANVLVDYQNMSSNKKDALVNQPMLAYSDSADIVKRAINKNVAISSTKQLANKASKEALRLRDKGMPKEAKALLQKSARNIAKKAKALGGKAEKKLNIFSESVAVDAEEIAKDKNWNKARKSFKAKQYKLDKQQSY